MFIVHKAEKTLFTFFDISLPFDKVSNFYHFFAFYGANFVLLLSFAFLWMLLKEWMSLQLSDK